MDDSQHRSRRAAPRPFYGPRPAPDRATPATPGAAARVTPSRGKSRLFTPPGSLPPVAARPRTEAASSPTDLGAVEAEGHPAEGPAQIAPMAIAGIGSERPGLSPIAENDSRDPAPGAFGTGDLRLEELKEIEPWAMQAGEASYQDPAERVADALERVARRFRAGQVLVPPDSYFPSDEAGLALALAALLRSGRG